MSYFMNWSKMKHIQMRVKILKVNCRQILKLTRMRYMFVFMAFALLAGGCKRTGSDGIYKEGRIEYKIQYLENNLHNISPSLLPKKMKLEFNQEYSTNLIEGFMGVFRLNNVISFKHKRSSTLLEVLNKNYVFRGKRGDEMCCFEPMGKMEIEYSPETKMIAGLNCQKAIIKFADRDEEFDVYYTHDISLDNPNVTNPYRDIDGVLMEFQLKLSGLKMKFTADKFEKTSSIVPEKIRIPENCAEVTHEQMTQIIDKLME